MNAKMKTVKIGGEAFEIQAGMTVAGIVGRWKSDSEELEKLVEVISANCPNLVNGIVHAYCMSHNRAMVDYDWSKLDEYHAEAMRKAADYKRLQSRRKKAMISPANFGIPAQATNSPQQ